MAYGEDAKTAMLPITYVYWFAGMGVIEYPVGHQRTILGLLYSSLVCIFYAICAVRSYFSDDEWDWDTESRLMDVSYSVYYGFNVIIVGFIIFVSIVSSKKRNRYIRELEAINEIMKGMGVIRSYKRFVVSQIWQIASLLVMMILIGTLTASSDEQMGESWSLSLLFFAQYPYFISSVNEILFCSFNDMMTASFEDLNLLLESLRVKHPYDSHGTENERVHIDVVLTDERKIEILYSIRKIYPRLARVVKHWNQINAVYILGIIIFSTWIFTFLVLAIYVMLSVIGILSIMESCFIQSLLTTIFLSVKLFMIVRSAVSLTSESRRTCGIVLKYLHPIASLRLEAHTFAMQLIQNPIDLSVLGLYSLDYSMLQQIFTNVATYLIMVVQTTNSLETKPT